MTNMSVSDKDTRNKEEKKKKRRELRTREEEEKKKVTTYKTFDPCAHSFTLIKL